jgi:hypothetical protein
MRKYKVLEIGFKPKVNDKIRLVLKVVNQLKPIFWFTLGRDGSVYFGLSLKRSDQTYLSWQLVKNIEGTIKFNVNDGKRCFGDIKKISHHGNSGFVHMPYGRGFSKDIRNIQEQIEICKLVLPPQRKIETILQARKKDIVLEYPATDCCPVFLHFHISPLGKQKPLIIPQAKDGLCFAIKFSNLIEISDRIFQITLWHGPEGPSDDTILVLPLLSFEEKQGH